MKPLPGLAALTNCNIGEISIWQTIEFPAPSTGVHQVDPLTQKEANRARYNATWTFRPTEPIIAIPALAPSFW